MKKRRAVTPDEVKGLGVYIMTPSHDGTIELACADSLFRAMRVLSTLGVNVGWFAPQYDSLVTRQRDLCAMQFLNSDPDVYTHLMFIDCDIHFSESAILELLLQKKDLIGGSYPIKSFDFDKMKKAMDRGVAAEHALKYATRSVVSFDPPKGQFQLKMDEPYPVNRLGTGFMLIKRNVFEEMIKKLDLKKVKSGRSEQTRDKYEFFQLGVDSTGLALSEDYWFCDAARSIGFQPYVYPGLELSHVGRFTFQGSFARSLGIIMPNETEAYENELLNRSLVTPGELDCIKKYATGKTKLAEIGVCFGFTSRHIREVMDQDAEFSLIDTFEPVAMEYNGKEVYPDMAVAKKNVDKSKKGTVRWLVMTSAQAVPYVDQLDFLFIDGNHFDPYPLEDWNNYKDKIIPGGHVLFHDYSLKAGHEGVIKAVAEAEKDPNFKLVDQSDSLVVFRRNL